VFWGKSLWFITPWNYSESTVVPQKKYPGYAEEKIIFTNSELKTSSLKTSLHESVWKVFVEHLLVTFKPSLSIKYSLLDIWCKTWSVLIAIIMLLSPEQRDRKFSETLTGVPNRHDEWLHTFGHFMIFKSVVQRYIPHHLFQGLTTFNDERTSRLRLHGVNVYEQCSECVA
jgi:hypothetical protein